ncbi:hypothetical protein H2200_006864 [Cladophialophora chaetospira]|uniref:Uncharacterized protein n=1 Tax=Cladophialophora chaetospira TaxID=386627 RepID=A0AA38X906_9EURO|nr:hypothetical protein H2200_006864 [Cladophialophora chaetospira]
MAPLTFSATVLVTLAFLLGLVGGDAAPCNPLNVTAACPPIPGLATNTYFMDFTTQTTTPGDWILADYATVNYASPDGANFTISALGQAPYIWSRFYVLFGHIEVVMKVAKGAGIVTGSVMMSDDLDEIDWEFSGNNFGQNSGQVLTNYFGKGQIGWSDRGFYPSVNDPQDTYHTYALDWQSDKLVWSIDGVPVRTLTNNGATSGFYQYPQTPARLHLGMWDAGDPSSAPGVVQWAGGYTDFSQAPFTAFVKSVKITTSNTCSSFQYPYPFDGTYQSVQCSNQTVALPCTYTVVSGDDGYKIAQKLTVNADMLKTANPGVNWDQLLVGQVLNVPGVACTTSSTTTSVSSPTSMSNSTTPMSTTSSSPSSTSSTSNSSTVESSTQTLSNISSSTTSMSSTTTSTTTVTVSIASNTTTSVVSTSSSALTTSTSTTITGSNSTAPTSSTSGNSTATSASATQSYTIAAGDIAWGIAQKNGCSLDALEAVNPGINWDNLQIGQTINMPSPTPTSSSNSTISGSTTSASSTSGSVTSTSTAPSSGTSTSTTSGSGTFSSTTSSSATSASTAQPYTVSAGDFGWAIAQKNGCSFDALNAANPGINWDNLQIGQSLNLPSSNSTSSSAPTVSGSSTHSTLWNLSALSLISTTPGTSSSSAPTVSGSSTYSTLWNLASLSLVSPTSGNSDSSSSGNPSTSSSSTSMGSNSASSGTTSNVLYPFGSGGSASSTGSAATSTTSTVSSSTSSASGSSSTGGSSTISPSASATPGTSTPTSTSPEAVSYSPKALSTTTSTAAISSPYVNAVNPVTTSKMVCNEDDCLRNLIDPRYSSSMREFCPKYTTKASNATPLPTFLGGCAGDVKRVSSACSCMVASYGPTGTSSSTAVSPSPFKSGAPPGSRVPSWLLKGAPVRWNGWR